MANDSNSKIDYLSYKRILQERQMFRQAGGRFSSEANIFDAPSYQFFKILFHFDNTLDAENTSGAMYSGLLHPTWAIVLDSGKRDDAPIDADEEDLLYLGVPKTSKSKPTSLNSWMPQIGNSNRAYELGWWRYNTAFSYLMQNDELERAQYLRKFIETLSNINSESPWYFQSIKGLDEAVKRQQASTGEMSFKERGKITIECLADSVDARISSLLDFYRAAVWSWELKKEIIPANLRKFDMSIILFQMPIANVNAPAQSKIKITETDGMSTSSLGDTSGYSTITPFTPTTQDAKKNHGSYKIFEFHNCEIDYGSSTAIGESVSNAEAKQVVYNIGIFYDDMYEIRYNEFMPDVDYVYDQVYMPVATITDVVDSNMKARRNNADDNGAMYAKYMSNERSLESGDVLSVSGEALSAPDYISRHSIGNVFGFSIDRTADMYVLDDNTQYNGLQYTPNGVPVGDLFEDDNYNGFLYTRRGVIRTNENLSNIFDDPGKPQQAQYRGRRSNYGGPIGDIFEDFDDIIYKDDIGNLFEMS